MHRAARRPKGSGGARVGLVRRTRRGTVHAARIVAVTLTASLTVATLAGCVAGEPAPTPAPSTPSSPQTPGPTGDAPQTPPSPELAPEASGMRDLAVDLDVPWSVVRLASGSALSGSTLISERDRARVLELTPTGELREVARVTGVVPGGEGGLLGLAVDPDEQWLYAYFTAERDNRIVRMPLGGSAGSLTLGAPTTVLSGIPKASNHNGGRLAFGPDGMLYATTGDAGQRRLARDRESLAGKILRLTPTGGVPADNPFDGSPVWSLGHRNPQGLAWDANGQLWASEFGQDTWDELNLIVPGGDYGWPDAEGIAQRPGMIDPLLQWSPAEASPSGIAVVGSTLFVATLRGRTLWSVHPLPEGARAPNSTADEPVATPWLRGELGRLRDAIEGPDGTLWVLTNETARGTPREGDDRLVELPLVERTRG